MWLRAMSPLLRNAFSTFAAKRSYQRRHWKLPSGWVASAGDSAISRAIGDENDNLTSALLQLGAHFRV